MITANELMSIAQKVSDVTGLDVAVTGGAVRDLLHNKVAKDVDLEILNWDGSLNKHSTVFNAIFDNIDYNAGSFESYGDSDSNVEFVIQFKCNGVSCDLILRPSHPTTVEDAVSGYDLNINKVSLYKGRLSVHEIISGNKIVAYQELPEDRFRRLSNKYPEYDWSGVKVVY